MVFADYMEKHGLTDGAFAAQLGVSGDLVRLYRLGRRIPAERALAIEKVTGIPRHLLRPDLWDPPVRRKRAPASPVDSRDKAAAD